MLSFENFVKSMPPSLSELKVTPSFCFAFKIPDDRAASTLYSNPRIYMKKLNIEEEEKAREVFVAYVLQKLSRT